MKDLFEPEAFFDGDMSTPAAWYSYTTGQQVEMEVIWRNDPFFDTPVHEAAEPEIEVHESFARHMQQGDRLIIESVDYEVRAIMPFDSEGFAASHAY